MMRERLYYLLSFLTEEPPKVGLHKRIPTPHITYLYRLGVQDSKMDSFISSVKKFVEETESVNVVPVKKDRHFEGKDVISINPEGHEYINNGLLQILCENNGFEDDIFRFRPHVSQSDGNIKTSVEHLSLVSPNSADEFELVHNFMFASRQ